MKWKLSSCRLLIFFSLVCLSTTVQGFAGLSGGLQQLLRRWEKPQPPASFLPSTNCTEWLRTSGETIVYNYGLDETASGARALRNCLSSDEAAESRARVRDIIVAFPVYGEPQPQQQSLWDLTQLLPNLQTVRWPCDWRGRSARVAFNDWCMQQNQTWHTEPCYEAYLEHGVPSFVECTSPAIESHVSYGSGGGNNAVNQLYDTLVSCPNVRSLSLSIRQGGCVIGNDLFAFNWKEGDVFPPLQNLTLSGYDWDAQGRNGRSNVQSWKKAMDWSQLKRLDIDLPPRSFLEAFGGQLHGLESFTLRPRWSFWGDEVTLCGFDNATDQLRKDYTSFITTLPSLRELSISGMGELLNMTPILCQHGASLERLSIHEFERDCNYATGNATWTRPFLSIPDIEEIKRSAPYLQSLTLDIYRSANRWPTATLKALSTFPNLTDLTINFDLEDPWRTKYAEHCMVREEARDEYCGVNELMRPYLNKTTVTDIFQRLRRFGGHDGAKSNIQTLTLYAGDHGRQEGGGLRIPFHYEHPKPIKFKCWVDGNGTEECNSRVGDWWDSMRYGAELD